MTAEPITRRRALILLGLGAASVAAGEESAGEHRAGASRLVFQRGARAPSSNP
jgi:hypothetical protein